MATVSRPRVPRIPRYGRAYPDPTLASGGRRSSSTVDTEDQLIGRRARFASRTARAKHVASCDAATVPLWVNGGRVSNSNVTAYRTTSPRLSFAGRRPE